MNDPFEALKALRWVVREMENRYCIMSQVNAKNIDNYNNLVDDHLRDKAKLSKTPSTVYRKNTLSKMPYIVIIIAELADLMATMPNQTEEYILRLTQMADNAGIHCIVATQHPTSHFLTGVIKAYLTNRICFRLRNRTESQTIADMAGIELLTSPGEMIYRTPSTSSEKPMLCGFISEKEIQAVADTVKKDRDSHDNLTITGSFVNGDDVISLDAEKMEYFINEALTIIRELGKISIKIIQNRMNIGFDVGNKIIEELISRGIIYHGENKIH